MLNVSSVVEFSDNSKESVCAVKFGAEWCGPCKIMEKLFSKLEGEFNSIKFMVLDVDNVPEITKQFKIRSVPTILILKDGMEVQRISGVSLIEPLRKCLKDVLV
jgi:thioredoxin 1